jgi:hypothetical protein
MPKLTAPVAVAVAMSPPIGGAPSIRSSVTVSPAASTTAAIEEPDGIAVLYPVERDRLIEKCSPQLHG